MFEFLPGCLSNEPIEQEEPADTLRVEALAVAELLPPPREVTAKFAQAVPIERDAFVRAQLERAVVLNHQSHRTGDDHAKKQSIEILNSICSADIAQDLYPTVYGAILQTSDGQKIRLDSAASRAYFALGKDTITRNGSGAFDYLVPGFSGSMRKIGMGSSGKGWNGEPDPIGPFMFGPETRGHDPRVVGMLALGYLNDEKAMQQLVDQSIKIDQGQYRDLITDGAAVSTGFAIRGIARSTAPKMIANAGTPGKLFVLGSSLAGAGLMKDLASDGELGNSTEFLRGAGMYGGSRVLLDMLRAAPSRRALSAEVTSKLEAAAPALAEQRSWSLLHTLNPATYSGVKNGAWVGFGGDTTALALTEGRLTMAEFYARRRAGDLLTLGGTGYVAGSGREGLYIATGKLKPDGSPHDFNSAFAAMNAEGRRVGAVGAYTSVLGAYAFTLGPSSELGLIGGFEFLQGTAASHRADRLRDLSSSAKELRDKLQKDGLRQGLKLPPDITDRILNQR